MAHIDKLKPWASDNTPRSWLTDGDQQLGPGNHDDVWDHVVDGGTPGMVNDDGWSKDAGGEVTQDPGDAYDVGEAGNTAGMVAPGTVHGGSDGHFNDAVEGMAPGVVSLGNSDQSGESGRVAEGMASVVDNDGQSGGVVGLMVPGVVNDGDGSERYTSDPNDGDRPSSYTFGHTDDVEKTESNSRDGERVTDGGPATSSAEPRRARVMPEQPDERDNAAIAGDPRSTTRLIDRPRRSVRRPARFSDYGL